MSSYKKHQRHISAASICSSSIGFLQHLHILLIFRTDYSIIQPDCLINPLQEAYKQTVNYLIMKDYVAENYGFVVVFVQENSQMQLGKYMWQNHSASG